jgi:hypothetical protein
MDVDLTNPTDMAGFSDPNTSGTTSVAPAAGSALLVTDFGDDAGAGIEDLQMEEQLTPFLRILQKGSPQVDPAVPEYQEHLRPGMIYNTATMEAYDGKVGVEVVVAARDYHYGRWIPRDAGGGYRGQLRPDDPTVRSLVAKHGRFKKLPGTTEEGETVDIVETIQFYVLYSDLDLSDANAQRALISMASTALPVAQQYLTRHNAWKYRQPDGSMKPAALWSYKWRFSLVPQQNASGSWFNWKIDLLPLGAKPFEALIPRTDQLFMAGRAFYDMYRGGEVKADYDDASPTSDGGKGGGDVPF